MPLDYISEGYEMTNARITAALALLLAVAGCNSDQQQISDHIDSGEVALGGNRFDAAVADADAAIKIKPTAEAYYLRGRAEEDRPKPDDPIASADLDRAKTDYMAALDLHPSKSLAARCRAGLANIAFNQGIYDVALLQWTLAIDDLDDDDWKSEALFHMAQCQQFLGRFDDADKTFKRVCDLYPTDDIAAQAQARIGVRGFYVQVGTFGSFPDAQSAMRIASDAGQSPRQSMDNGQILVRCGPYTTLAQAQSARSAIASQYPNATIEP
jgi:tetratricopeptide (TPR) repeat protein